MVNRIKQVMEYKQMSPTVFADTIDINRSSLTHIFSGRNQPSLDVAKKILVAFPEISTEWLIMGIGEMVQADKIPAEPVATNNPPTSVSTVDNMQQTDLFAEIGMFEGLAYPSTKSQPETLKPVTQPKIEKEQAVKLESEATPASPQENYPVIEPEETPVIVRNRAKNSESHISTRESKRERISNSQGDKKITKIIFFYDDRSFEIYTPN